MTTWVMHLCIQAWGKAEYAGNSSNGDSRQPATTLDHLEVEQ